MAKKSMTASAAARRVTVANAIDKHEHIRKNSDDPAALTRADRALQHAVDESVAATAVDEYLEEEQHKK